MSEQPKRWIYFFGQGQADAGGDLKHLVGGKGASLADMTRAGLKVPPGFTISAECCDYFYKNHLQWAPGLEEQVLESLQRLEQIAARKFGQGDDPLLVAVRSGAAQSMPGMMDTILNVGLNPDCVRALAQRTGQTRTAWEAYYHFLLMYLRTVQEVPEVQLGQREESQDAGQLEALCLRLGQSVPADPWDQLRAAVNAVFGSWHTERAVAYRRHHKIEGLLGTAVNVQMMCPSEVSGVMFTANPINPALEEILIESSYGLGEAIVLGKVNPDRFILDKKTLTIAERNIAKKDFQVASLGQGEPEGVSPRSAGGASLNDEQIIELARLGQRVEAYFNTPCDIEWALSRGEFFLLQSRAIKLRETNQDLEELERVKREEIEALRAMAAPGGTVWSRFNLSEILPEPTPMTWAIVKRFMSGQGGYGQMYRDLGFDPDPALDEVGVFDLVCGRPYCNLSREPKMQYRSLPFEHRFSTLKANPARAMYPQAVMNPAKAGWKFWLFLPAVFFKLWRSSARLQQTTRTFADKFQQQIVPPFVKEVEQAGAEDWSKLTNQQLADKLEHWIRRTLFDFARESLKPTALAAIAMGNLERVLAQRYQTPGTKLTDDEPTGLQRAQAALRQLVMGVKPEEGTDVAQGLRALASGNMSRETFVRDFGHRGSQEMELARPRWAEDAFAVERLAGQQSTATEQSPPDLQGVMDRVAAETRLLPFQRKAIEGELATLHKYLGLRETAKHHLLRGYALIRRALVELDRRFGLDGGIFYLTLEDLPRLLASEKDGKRLIQKVGQAFQPDGNSQAFQPDGNSQAFQPDGNSQAGKPDLQEITSLIQQRRRRRELALSLPVPQVLFSDDLETIGREIEVGGANALQGVPLSAGVAEGPAWVLHEPTNSHPPNDAYILVCPSTDPAWVPLFANAKGLIMETGGVLSHGAIVARDFGLPAVAGIADVHRRLITGQRLRIDGATGKVNVLAG